MKAIIQRLAQGATRLAVATLAALAAGGAWASIEMTNPVTGQKETYVNTFTGGTDGTDTEWNDSSNWDTSVTPFVSGDYNASLVDGKTASTSTAIDGYTLRVGAYNGAAVTWSGGITKIQAGTAGCWLTADATSSITLAFNGNSKQLEGSSTYPLKLSSAKAGGITWTSGLANAGNTSLPFWYYLKGAGTVVYGGDITVANAQVIKMADVTLSGNAKSVQPKTLVSFGSGTTMTFTADAAIKVYGTDGTTLATTVNLATVNTTGSTTLTTSDPVGTVELVQTSTGVVLYYVDGDPADVNVGEKTYKPSISVNFTSGTALSTAGDVGLAGYAVPGTSWNNLTVENNATLSSLNKIDSTGAATASSASVTITNTRGEWHCSSLVATSDMRAGYIDETADVTTPTVTVSGIPYDQYKVVVYTATDAANVKFGYVTINGTNYTYSDGAVAEGTTAWGASGAKNTAEALAEGVNVLVSPVVSGGTLTVVGHRSGTNPRGCIAAVQIVKVEQEVGENDLLIDLDGDRTYTFDEAKAYSGTVYVTGSGTLTFDGAASTAATLHIGPAAAVNMVGSALTPTTVTGNGTVVYDGVKPTTGLGWTNSANWTGTVWVKNITASSDERKEWNPALYGNEESTLRFTDVNLYFPNNTTTAFSGTVELDAGGLNICDGHGGTKATFAKLTGSGTLSTGGGSSSGNGLMIRDASEFTGTITLTKYKVIIGSSDGTSASGVLQIDSGAVATVASGKTWTAPGGFVVNGTLNADGTLASSHASQAVSGSGMVVFAGKMPSPTTDAWWKNAAWTGTVQIKSAAFTGVSGVNTYLDVNKYGNDGSVLELNNCSGWLPVGNTTGDNVCAVPLKVTGTLTINDGYSNRKFTINKLLGNGAIYTTSNGATVTIQVLSADDFTGYVNLNSKRVIFGETVPETFTSGQIYVGEGFSFTVPNSDVAWYGTGGITLAGELKAAALSNFGGGTTITTTDTGVFTLVSNSNADDMNVDYTRIQGTGTLKFEGSAYRCISTNNFPTAMIVENNLNNGLIHRNAGITVSIGSLSGSGQMRSDWGGSGSTGDRDLRILQAKDTTYSGLFASSNDRIDEVYVAPGASTAGTLTLSGTQTASNGLIVESGAKVNLTGTWVGATTVSGTFGGTGTLTGNLTFSAGSTFKAFASDTDGLAVSGTVTCPAEGTVAVDVSALEQTGTKVLMTASDLDVSKFALAGGQSGTLSVADGALKVSFVTYVAEYNGVKYETVQEAIDAAEQAGETYANVTILDATAECPAGYYVDTDNSNALTKYQAAIVKKNDAGKDYFKTGQLAFDAIATGSTYYGVYDYVEIYYGTGVEVSVNPAAIVWTYGSDPVRIKCYGEATVTVSLASTESTLTAGTADENGIVTYTKADVATTYVWAGGTTQGPWSNPNKWKVGTLEGATATRKPGALDTVQIGDGAKVSDIVGSLSVAALQVSGAVTFIGDGGGTLTSASAITLGTGDSITITGTLSPVPTTTVANSYVKATTSGGTTTYAVDAYKTVTITGSNMTATVTPNSEIKSGDVVTITVAPAEGYVVDSVATSSGTLTNNGNGIYSLTVDGDATITVTAVEVPQATISDVTFNYMADYTSAKTVTATVSAAGTYTLTVGDKDYNATAETANSTITFNNVTGLSLGSNVNYTITAGGTASGTYNGNTTVGNVTPGWVQEDSTHTGNSGTGTWATPVTYTDSKATISDNTYTANTAGNGIVTLTTVVKFGDEADPEVRVGDDAQAAIRIQTVESTPRFQVYGKTEANGTAAWQTITTVQAEAETTYMVSLTINYTTGTFTASVQASGAESATPLGGTWYLATDASKISAVAYKGTGEFTSLNGSFVSGDIAVTVKSPNDVAVSSAFISQYLGDETVADATALLAPDSTTKAANGCNYFESYALGLNPEVATDKPIVSATPNADGGFTVKLTNSEGNALEPAGNVSLTYKLMSGDTPNGLTEDHSQTAAEFTIDPSKNGVVKYYKIEVNIGAK